MSTELVIHEAWSNCYMQTDFEKKLTADDLLCRYNYKVQFFNSVIFMN